VSPENTKRLFEELPQLFRGRFQPITQNLMPFGFECHDGWLPLIHTLCAKITVHAAEAKLDVMAVQVKEKWGALRFYVHGEDDYIESLIRDAEEASSHTCEWCGAPGGLWSRGGWYVTRCEEHIRA